MADAPLSPARRWAITLTVMMVVMLVGGMYFFKRTETSFADII